MRSSCLKRGVSILLAISMVGSGVRSVGAQAAAAPVAAPAQNPVVQNAAASFETGQRDGEAFATEADQLRGKGLAVTGVLAAFTFWGILGVLAIGPSPMPPFAAQKASSGDADYQAGFKKGWDQTTQTRKRKSFMKGAVGALVALVSLMAIAAVGLIDGTAPRR